MESHLLQMRGLKPVQLQSEFEEDVVASFTDAWIETVGGSGIQPIPVSHLLQMRGLKL